METKFDVVVIGGGPAGMMAAARASARGRSVLLLEKNKALGKKLSITGGGRCNVTNNKPVVRDILSQYKDSGKFLFSTFMQYGAADTIAWFKERGVEFVEENEGRLFPSSLKAETICTVMRDEVEKQRVTVQSKVVVSAIEFDKNKNLFTIKTTAGDFVSEACVVATGGTSHPETGSTGEGFAWLQSLGHEVKSGNMALVPLMVEATWLERVSGVALPEVKLTIFVDDKKKKVQKGKILFTHVGVTGPTILNLSKSVGEFVAEGEVVIKVDLLPALDAGELKAKLQELLVEHSNKKLKNIISEWIPASLVAVVLEEAGVSGENFGHSVSKEDKVKLLKLLKALPLPIDGLLGEDKAVVSDGGVVLEEVDFKTMESKVVPKLYLVGDVLNINRPSGGYSLQICWSTGFVAGDNA